MWRRLLPIMLPFLLAGAAGAGEVKTTLKGSRGSMERQNQVAHELDYSFPRTEAQVEQLADAGSLVTVPGGEHYEVLATWPWARPAVRDFVERLADRYQAGCGEPLVVTSLTRPVRRQPRNASPLSVHPAGMAVDLRVSRNAACVAWLQEHLLGLEEEGLIDATREYHPPHFHVAVFPGYWEAYSQQLTADSAARAEALRADSARAAAAAVAERMAAPATHGADREAPPGVSGALLLALVSLARFLLPV